MRKIILLGFQFILLLANIYIEGQTIGLENITTDLPQIIPPSPTVSSLMKFEEVPVSNYTGVPDISIPLFSVSTRSKDISVNIALKYHTSNIAADEIASDVGLGWNLLAGGTVSRTVKGHPDEEMILSSATDQGKVGIYHTTATNYTNNFYYFSKNILSDYKTSYKPNLSASDQLIGNEFIWSANRTDKYDTEQDLWQFNFFGRTGRFYIKKNDLGNLEVVPLDHYTLKIINHYDSSNYKPTAFTIFDDKGYKYFFSAVEVSNNSGGIRNYYYDSSGVLQLFDYLYEDKEFNSSFHLSQVIDPNNNILVEYSYNENEMQEGFTKVTTRTSEFSNSTDLKTLYELNNPCGDFPPVKSITRSSTFIKVKKISAINIVGIAKVKFEYLQNREDSNLDLPGTTASSLKSVALYNWNDGFIKKYNFNQEYRTVLEKRMFLTKLDEIDKNNQIMGSHQFSYETNNTVGKVIGKDFWGYYNVIDPCESYSDPERRRKTSPSFSTTDILQKIKYPTGGSAIFDFEANRYSYIGNNPVTDFSDNKSYTPLYAENLSFNKNNPTSVLLPVSSSNRKVSFYPSISLSPDNNTRKMYLEVYNGSGWETAINNIVCPQNVTNCCIPFILDKNKSYRVVWSNLDLYYNGTDILGIHYAAEDPVANNFLYGGGNRIKRIGYFIRKPLRIITKPCNLEYLHLPKKKNIFTTMRIQR